MAGYDEKDFVSLKCSAVYDLALGLLDMIPRKLETVIELAKCLYVSSAPKIRGVGETRTRTVPAT